jgi:hypothetical protein
MAVNNPQKQAKDLVSVSDWNACLNSGDNMLVLSCKVATNDSSATIEGVGLILNSAQGATLASLYTELSGGVESASPALNLAPGNLAVGASIEAVVSGEVNGQHYFFEQTLSIGEC